MVPKKLCLAQNPDADRLLTESPLALLIGLVLDQQMQQGGSPVPCFALQRGDGECRVTGVT